MYERMNEKEIQEIQDMATKPEGAYLKNVSKVFDLFKEEHLTYSQASEVLRACEMFLPHDCKL